VSGTSKTGTGLRGASTSQYGLNATSVSGTAILAKTTSGLYAIDGIAEGSGGTGVAGLGFDRSLRRDFRRNRSLGGGVLLRSRSLRVRQL
jgi:hypothetical protein